MTDHQSLFQSIDGGIHEIFDLEALKDYVDHGGDVNVRNEFGDTFLHVAVRNGKIEVVRSLLNFSALVDQKNLMMDTPIQADICNNSMNSPHHSMLRTTSYPVSPLIDCSSRRNNRMKRYLQQLYIAFSLKVVYVLLFRS